MSDTETPSGDEMTNWCHIDGHMFSAWTRCDNVAVGASRSACVICGKEFMFMPADVVAYKNRKDKV